MKLTLGHKLIEHLSDTMLVFKKAYNSNLTIRKTWKTKRRNLKNINLYRFNINSLRNPF